MSGRLGRHLIGRYGVGTLWCVRERDAFFIQFNASKIATRPLREAPGWPSKTAGKLRPTRTVKSVCSCAIVKA
jgi:hypothetical protein